MPVVRLLGQGPPRGVGPPGGIPVDPPAPVPVVDCDQEGQTIQNSLEDTGRDGIVVGFDRGKLEQLLGLTGAA